MDLTAQEHPRPLISCMMATRGRDGMIQRAIRCFQAQVYAPLELVIVRDPRGERVDLSAHCLHDRRIRIIDGASGMELGALRNLLVQEARGEYVATWDDDDWSAPNRLAEQMRVIAESGKAACVLGQITLADEPTGRAFLSARRVWEGTILVKKNALPRYDDGLAMREDTTVLRALVQREDVAFLERPELYIYVYHGANTWDRTHWERNILGHSKELPPASATAVLDKLNGRA